MSSEVPVAASYETTGFADFYKELLQNLPPEYEPGADVEEVYWPILKAGLAAAPPPGPGQPFAVLDLCTGSGRVVLGLLQRLSSLAEQYASGSTPVVRLVGVDSSAEMLAAAQADLAAGQTALPPNCSVALHCADIAALGEQQLGQLQLLGACRLVIISAGSFHHLLTPADQLACLKAVAAALARQGPAYAVVNIFDPGHLQSVVGEAAVLGPFRRTCVHQSAEQDGGVDGGSASSTVWRQRFQLQRYASPAAAAAADEAQMLWSRAERWELREVAPAQLTSLAAQAGLRVMQRQARWRAGWTLDDGQQAVRCAEEHARIFVLALQN